MTGLLSVFGDVVDTSRNWFAHLVFSPKVWLGMIIFVVAFVLIGGANAMSRRIDPQAGQDRARARSAKPKAVRADLTDRPAHRRRDGRDPGDPEEARHLLMRGTAPGDSHVARNRLWSRLTGAVAALDTPPPTPLMVVDLDAFDANAADLARRAGGKPIRVASKSLRVPALIERALATPGFHGVLGYTLREALWLEQQGISDDIVIAYPTVDRAALARAGRLARRPRAGSR